MEAQEEVKVNRSRNGVERSAPALEIEQAPSLELKVLLEKREKMVQGLNAVKADCEALAEQLTQQRESEKRTEGALIMLSSLIQELDPQALSGQGRGR